MQEIENVKVLILTNDDLINEEAFLDVLLERTYITNWLQCFNENSRNAVRNAGLVLYVDPAGNTTILKNRYGKPQI